jgi:predicted transcriptional regulator
MAESQSAKVTDKEARELIIKRFYEVYQEHGLHVIVDAQQITNELKLDPAQERRCFDYLAATGLIKPMTRGGGYSPTVELVDAVEGQQGAPR